MDTAAMRRLDARFGVPLCALATLHRRLRRRRPPTDRGPRRILVIKLAEQGATVVAEPALRAATEMVGAENVFMMVFAENRPILDELGLIPAANVLAVRSDGALRLGIDVVRGLRRVRRERVDAVVDLEFFSRASAFISYLSGATRRVGHHASFGEASYRGDLLTHRVNANPRLHVADAYWSLVAALGQPADRLPALAVTPPPAGGPASTVTPTGDEIRRVTDLVEGLAPAARGRRWVLVNANTGDLLPLRRWPTERYEELVGRLLADRDDLVVVLTGSPAEAADTDALAAAIGSPRCVSVAGRTTIRELLVLYGLSEVMVTNDSGPAHYSALTDIDVVTLFGPESPAVFGSRSPRAHDLYAALACSPCVNVFNDRRTTCANNLCMQAIGVDEVRETVGSILDTRAARRAGVNGS